MPVIFWSTGDVRTMFMVDEDDADLAKWRWSSEQKGYGRLTSCTHPVFTNKSFLHKCVASRMGLDGLIDHINQKPWDNRRSNLRSATSSQNQANRPKQSNNTSGFKGVFEKRKKGKSTGKWFAQIRVNRKDKYLGCFDDPKEAALAYNKAAAEYFGEFASFNKIH